MCLRLVLQQQLFLLPCPNARAPFTAATRSVAADSAASVTLCASKSIVQIFVAKFALCD